jgi:hypothetical protein
METIFNVINPFFSQKWKLYKQAENTLCYRNQADEFVVTMFPTTGGIEIKIPLKEVVYKNTFYNINTAIEYMKMHLNYYDRN